MQWMKMEGNKDFILLFLIGITWQQKIGMILPTVMFFTFDFPYSGFDLAS